MESRLHHKKKFRRISNEFLDHLTTVKEMYGPESVAGIISSNATNEAAYLFQKFFRCNLGSNNIMSLSGSEVEGDPLSVFYSSLGILTTSPKLETLPDSEVVIFCSTCNPPDSTEKINSLIKKARKQNDARIICIGPAPADILELADIVFDVSLRYVPELLRGILREACYLGGIDRAVIWRDNSGFQNLYGSIKKYTEEFLYNECSVPGNLLQQATIEISRRRAVSMVITGQSPPNAPAAQIVQDALNLMLATGHIGNSGQGLFYHAEGNQFGVSFMGASPNILPGLVPISGQTSRDWFSQCWDRDIPEKPGIKLHELKDSIKSGQIRILIYAGDDPADEVMGHIGLTDYMERLDFLAGASPRNSPLYTYWWPIHTPKSTRGSWITSDQQILYRHPRSEDSAPEAEDWRVIGHWLSPDSEISYSDIYREISTTVPGLLGIPRHLLLSEAPQYLTPCCNDLTGLVSTEFSISELPVLKFRIPPPVPSHNQQHQKQLVQVVE